MFQFKLDTDSIKYSRITSQFTSFFFPFNFGVALMCYELLQKKSTDFHNVGLFSPVYSLLQNLSITDFCENWTSANLKGH